MRILAYVHYYPPHNRGGAEIMLHSMLKALVDEGHQVWVGATRAPKGRWQVDKVRVVGGREAAGALLRKKWDRIITHLNETEAARSQAKKSGTHFTQIIHNQHPVTRHIMPRDADLTVYNTEWVRQDLAMDGDGDSIVVHPPVDPAQHGTAPGEAITLVNLVPEKGTEIFYRSALVHKGMQFLAVEGGYFQHRQVIQHRDNITHQPHTQDMKGDVWSRTKLLLMPSTYESFGQVALEAAASGIPTIASDTPGLRECLADAGTFIHSHTSPVWSQVIRRMMVDEDLYAVASAKALDRSAYMHDQTRKELKTWVETLASA